MNKKKVIAVIPALDEEKTIAKVIRGVKQYCDEVILIDDASFDKTAFIAKQEGAVVVTNCKNQGYDKSIDNGFKIAADRGASVVLTFDADGQHNPKDIPAIIEPIISGKADVVVGIRPFRSRTTEHLFAFVAKRKLGVCDPLCGLKAYSINVYKDIGYFDRISSIGTELLFNAASAGYRIVQINIDLNRRKDIPRFGRAVKANWKIFKAIIKIIFYGGAKNGKNKIG
ncbi:MAG: glycosyltransferase family 2 protein [Candidatus Omnitrophica bacterium]|nr:glycosyltransferase family 2 protein [Candidatus Omnitrophota bacterium]